jgi:hypothetical protein
MIEFNEARHKYFLDGKEVSGVTKVIGLIMNERFPTGSGKGIHHINVAREHGKAKHGIIQYFIDNNKLHEEAGDDEYWLIKMLKTRFPITEWTYLAEVLVTDNQYFASAIDIVCLQRGTNNAVLIDTKTGEFKREYCSWQLGMYKYMFELEKKQFKVVDTLVFCTKDQMVYKIFPKEEQEIVYAFDKFKYVSPAYIPKTKHEKAKTRKFIKNNSKN